MTTRTLEKITVVVTVAVLGVALAVLVGQRPLPQMILVVAGVVTVSAGLDLVLRGEARHHPTPDLFILPAALVVGAALFLPLLASGAAVVAGLALFAALLFGAFWAEYRLRLGRLDRQTGETILSLIGYVAAFLLYAAIYQSKARSLVSAPAIVAVTFLLALRQLRLAQTPLATGAPAGPGPATLPASHADGPSAVPGLSTPGPGTPGPGTTALRAVVRQAEGQGQRRDEAPGPGTTALRAVVRRQERVSWARSLPYAAVMALASGEITWALNYWPLNGLLGGAFLLACFYCLANIFTCQVQGQLTRRVVAEYGAVAAASIVLLSLAGLLRRPGG